MSPSDIAAERECHMEDGQGSKLDPHIRMGETLEVEVVRAFLRSVQALDPDAAAGLLSENFVMSQSGLPSVRGRAAFRHVFGLAASLLSSFDLVGLEIAGNGEVVLTARREFVKVGPLEMVIWAFGRFEVQSGEIVRMHDYFDFGNLAFAGLRGLAGIVVPPLRPSRKKP
ncbi:limonene-1,2-epoxide hydrolase family protein [Antrihabitans spumae]|uniref:Limonene-1,2-epoxide hydrolase family protein n=1 Tax=Antrihabitans spumae TaxID=3373370 RepID=A0ABW7KMV8_9NOCA